MPRASTPGAGSYTPRQPVSTATSGRPTAGMASASARRLPFESGGGRGTDLQVPGPARYSPHHQEDFTNLGKVRAGVAKAGVPVKGAAALTFTSPRFTHGHYNHARHENPGPGAYTPRDSDRTLGGGGVESATSASAYKRLPLSTQERTLMFEAEVRNTPGPGHYACSGQRRGMGERFSNATTPTSQFASASSRLVSALTLSPGPGGYQPYDGKGTADASMHVPKPIRRSASFGSSSTRFKKDRRDTPGPGSYQHDSQSAMASPRRFQQATASFASSSARTQLPLNRSAAIVPGPGGYEHPSPIADGTRPLRHSASFASASSRLKMSHSGTPPPGAYNPQKDRKGRACSGATQRYSIRRIAG